MSRGRMAPRARFPLAHEYQLRRTRLMKHLGLACFLIATTCFPRIALAQIWSNPTTQISPNAASKMRYGRCVALSGDVLAVTQQSGEPWSCPTYSKQEGTVFVYERLGSGGWGLQASIGAPQPYCSSYVSNMFGYALAIDGDTLAVSAEGEQSVGTVRIYERDLGGPGAWGLAVTLTGQVQSGRFGSLLALSQDTLAVGSASLFNVTLFGRNQGSQGAWGELAQIVQTSPFVAGTSMDLDGDRLAIGNGFTGSGLKGQVHIHERDHGGSEAWDRVTTIEAAGILLGDGFPRDLALDGERLFVSSSSYGPSGQTGLVHVFERDAGGPNQWGETARITPGLAQYDEFGSELDVDGDRLVVGSSFSTVPRTGVFVFERNLGGANSYGLAQMFEVEHHQTFGDGPGLVLDGTTLALGNSIGDVGQWIHVTALALDPVKGIVYGSSPPDTGPFTQFELMRFDLAASTATSIGQTGFGTTHAMAFDPSSSTLFAVVDEGGMTLVVLDPTTGTGTVVGPLDPNGTLSGDIEAMAHDPATGQLWATTDTELIRVDPTGPTWTPIGPLGAQASGIGGLAYDAAAGVLYGVGDGELFELDPGTGLATPTLALVNDYEALVHDPVTGLLIGSDTHWDAWRTIDPTSGVEAHLMWAHLYWGGTLHLWERSEPTAYCTAGTSPSGCQATLSSSGFPSPSHSAGFELRVDQAEGAANGLFYYGTGPAQANPWSGSAGLQCIAPPVRRAPPLTGLGTAGSCDGSFALDLNTLWATKPHHYPGPGRTVRAQLWYSGPVAQGSNLSNAIEFQTAP